MIELQEQKRKLAEEEKKLEFAKDSTFGKAESNREPYTEPYSFRERNKQQPA